MLITGGATGIGLALAEALLKAGNTVAVCGRRIHKLAEVEARFPQLITRPCDIAQPTEREALYRWAELSLPHLNVLVNNAGIQRMLDLHAQGQDGGRAEVETNLMAPISLSAYFLPLLCQQAQAAIINVTSGLGFVPIAAMPVYCASKAALHSFTVSLRFQLQDTSIKVFELIPPAVATELGREEGEEEPSYPGIPPKSRRLRSRPWRAARTRLRWGGGGAGQGGLHRLCGHVPAPQSVVVRAS